MALIVSPPVGALTPTQKDERFSTAEGQTVVFGDLPGLTIGYETLAAIVEYCYLIRRGQVLPEDRDTVVCGYCGIQSVDAIFWFILGISSTRLIRDSLLHLPDSIKAVRMPCDLPPPVLQVVGTDLMRRCLSRGISRARMYPASRSIPGL